MDMKNAPATKGNSTSLLVLEIGTLLLIFVLANFSARISLLKNFKRSLVSCVTTSVTGRSEPADERDGSCDYEPPEERHEDPTYPPTYTRPPVSITPMHHLVLHSPLIDDDS